MKKITLLLFLFVVLFASCTERGYFRVEGKISGGRGSMIYLEHVLPNKIVAIDSMKIGRNERFRFKREHPPYPDFYRIRINGGSIIFAVESSERVVIRSEDPHFFNYTITGSDNIKKIDKLNQSILRLERGIRAFEENLNSENAAANLEKITQLIAQHDSLARSIIYSDTKSSAAYHAVFHKVGGSRFFHASNENDAKHFMAVATAFNAFYPHSARSKELTKLVRQAKQLKESEDLKRLLLQNSRVPTAMNFNLPNSKGDTISMADFRGKVVLVNFAYFKTDQSMEYVYGSRDLYAKYHKKGFEMIGISFDGDAEFFQNVSKRVPWIRVFDEQGLNSDLLEIHDIIQLPTLFVVDKEGSIVSRHTYLDSTLKENIARLLNE